MAEMLAELVAELDAAIAGGRLAAVADQIRANASECYAMIATGQDDYSTTGNTRFGGEPDLPEGMSWPVDPDQAEPAYCNFIAQINFAELPPLSESTGLPARGMLYLFVRSMESAADPVILDALTFDGPLDLLSRRQPPDDPTWCDEYLTDLIPQRIRAVPAVSIANYRRHFRKFIDDGVEKIDGEDGETRRHGVTSALRREGQIGQMLGFADAGDERENLYRQVVLESLGKFWMTYSDHWDTMAEYEAEIARWEQRDARYVKGYQDMRPDVEWLIDNGEMIANAADRWRLLFQIDSNRQMELTINDADPLYVFIQQDDLARANFTDLAGRVTQG